MQVGKFDWGTALFIIGYHVALLIGLPIYYLTGHAPGLAMWVISIVLMYISGLSITAGYHRYYAHTSYKTHNRVLECFFLFFGTLATQGSALKWACDHRRHHAYVDTDNDPYSIKKGFWHAHIFWLFRRSHPVEKSVVADLYRNKLVMFQHKYYVPLMFSCNLAVVLFIGFCFQDYLSAFLFAWGVRLFLLHHLTWFINSLAHTWGSQSFSQEHSAVDNYIISLLTFGEGYHNYHHTFANDYRNGVHWFHFDPTKWLIWLMSKLGLAHGLRRASNARIQERVAIERKRELLEKISTSNERSLLEQKIEKITQENISKSALFHQLREKYKEYKRNNSNKTELRKLDAELKSLKRDLKENIASLKQLVKGSLTRTT